MSGLHVNNLSHAFDGQPVVQGVSVFVAPGEVVCLLGPSGCGKTTLLRVAAGLEPLQKGQVRVGETVVDDAATGQHVPPDKRGVGLMFQDYALFPHLTVRENVRFGAGADTPERGRWIDAALAQMGLANYADSYPHILSGGQQQRVALLRALAPEPRVLFLDEPFSGLDVTRRAAVRAETLKLLRATGVATLLVTHDPEEAMFMADRILVMHRGRVVQDGTPDEIYFHPATAFVAELFGAVNPLAGTVRDGRVATPLGGFAAPGFADGVTVRALIRQEAIRLAEGSDAGFAVTGAHTLGRASLVGFLVPAADGGETEVTARVPGVFLPVPGTRVTATVNPDQVHVFATAELGE